MFVTLQQCVAEFGGCRRFVSLGLGSRFSLRRPGSDNRFPSPGTCCSRWCSYLVLPGCLHETDTTFKFPRSCSRPGQVSMVEALFALSPSAVTRSRQLVNYLCCSLLIDHLPGFPLRCSVTTIVFSTSKTDTLLGTCRGTVHKLLEH